jgi:enolase
VLKAIRNVNEIIAPNLVGMDVRYQQKIDQTLIELDGTPNKSRLGGNAIVATSLAAAKAAAAALNIPLYLYIGGVGDFSLPVPLMNLINGGLHAGNELTFQEFLVIPIGAERFSEALRMAVEIYHTLKDILKSFYGPGAVNVGDEGGFAPPMKKNEEALEALAKAIGAAGYVLGEDIVLGLDVAASHIFDSRKRTYRVDGKSFTSEELQDYYTEIAERYSIKILEDPFHEEDVESFRNITNKLRNRLIIVGDDLFATSVRRLESLGRGVASGAIVKVNQAGTLTEALSFARKVSNYSMKVVVSHRSGETEDTAIAHIAVGLRADFVKMGAPARGERTAKYNELLRIEEYIGPKYVGRGAFS